MICLQLPVSDDDDDDDDDHILFFYVSTIGEIGSIHYRLFDCNAILGRTDLLEAK